MRTIARFTPAKRARLGAPSLSAALDADEDFRAQVAEVVTEASPQLVEAIRDGSVDCRVRPGRHRRRRLPHPAGRLGPTSSATANARWTAEQGGARPPDRRARTAACRARRTPGAGEGRSRAVRDAVDRGDGRLAGRRSPSCGDSCARAPRSCAPPSATATTAQRGRGCRAAQRESAARWPQRGRAAPDASRHHRTRTRRSGSADARPGPTATSTTRGCGCSSTHWARRSQASVASCRCRRPPVRPADAVESAAQPSSAPPTRRTDDPPRWTRCSRCRNVHVIVDGYNVTKTGYAELSLADQRNRLIDWHDHTGGRSGAEITIAFDGGARPPAQPRTPRGVRVLFSAPDEIADDLIRRLVAAEPAGASGGRGDVGPAGRDRRAARRRVGGAVGGAARATGLTVANENCRWAVLAWRPRQRRSCAAPEASDRSRMLIDCDTCVVRGDACRDCVVTDDPRRPTAAGRPRRRRAGGGRQPGRGGSAAAAAAGRSVPGASGDRLTGTTVAQAAHSLAAVAEGTPVLRVQTAS